LDEDELAGAADGVTSGQGLLAGSLFGATANTAAEGESAEIATVSVTSCRS
jgi:predicted RecA/RadA family phage recombinase